MSDKPQSKPAAPAASSGIAGEVVVIIFILIILSGAVGFGAGFLGDGMVIIKDTLHRVRDVLVTVATVISMLAFVVIIYSFMRISEISHRETEKLGLVLNWGSEKKQKNERWARVETHMSSLNPSDWKIAILEADNILDQVVERMGYEGSTLGERMKMIEAGDFPYLEEAWDAHKTRNAIAHKGTDYVLNRSEAEQTINIYHRIFKELGYL